MLGWDKFFSPVICLHTTLQEPSMYVKWDPSEMEIKTSRTDKENTPEKQERRKKGVRELFFFKKHDKDEKEKTC